MWADDEEGTGGGGGIEWTGEYDPLAAYTTGQAVGLYGASYIASGTPTAGVYPYDDIDNWDVLAARGATGAQGPAVEGGGTFFEDWNADTTYASGDLVLRAGGLFKSTGSNTGYDPVANPMYWTPKLIASSVYPISKVWVDCSNGDDSTGKVGVPGAPFRYIGPAISAAGSGVVHIHLSAGLHSTNLGGVTAEVFTSGTPLRKVNITGDPGAIILDFLLNTNSKLIIQSDKLIPFYGVSVNASQLIMLSMNMSTLYINGAVEPGGGYGGYGYGGSGDSPHGVLLDNCTVRYLTLNYITELFVKTSIAGYSSLSLGTATQHNFDTETTSGYYGVYSFQQLMDMLSESI